MPIYEYQCKHCGCKVEALQKHSDQPLTTCPECGKNGLEKCVSLTSFKLKGKGWYETDFKGQKPVEKQEDKKAQPAASNKMDKTKKGDEK